MKPAPRFHEKEAFTVLLPRLTSWGASSIIFRNLGFSLMDDFARKMRTDDAIEVWQSGAIAMVEFLKEGKSVYPDEEDFDSLLYSVLPCTLPEFCVRESLMLLFKLASALGGTVEHEGLETDLHGALALVEQWRNDILEETGDIMGSECGRILLSLHYQR